MKKLISLIIFFCLSTGIVYAQPSIVPVPLRITDDTTTVNSPFEIGFSGGIVSQLASGGALVTITGATGAPTTADYLVGTANGSLSAEIVAGTSPQGELGGTWASPTIDDGVSVTNWTMVTPALGTPSALVGTNITGTAASLTAGNVTTNANLTGEVTSSGNAATVDKTSVTGRTFTVPVTGDSTVFSDSSDSDNLKKFDIFQVTSPNPCGVIENLAAADDNKSLGSRTYARTIDLLWCHYVGTGTTTAQISLEDGSGNAMTHTTPVCAPQGTLPIPVMVTAANTLVAHELLVFDVDNTPDPTTDDYTICWREYR